MARMGGGLSRSQADEEKAEDEIARLRRNTSMRSWAKNALLQPKEEEAPAALSPVKPVDSIVPVDPREGLKDELARQLVKLIALCNAPDAIPAWAREVEGMEQDLLRFKDSISAKGTEPDFAQQSFKITKIKCLAHPAFAMYPLQHSGVGRRRGVCCCRGLSPPNPNHCITQPSLQTTINTGVDSKRGGNY